MSELNARDLMEAITDEKLKNLYVGKHTIETLKQMVFSLFNDFKPQTMTDKEIFQKTNELAGIMFAIHEFEDSTTKTSLLQSIDAKLKNVLGFKIKPCECTENKIEEPTKINDDGLVHKDGSGNDGLIRHP